MACSTLKSCCTEQTIVHSTFIRYIFASIDEAVLTKISATIGKYRPQDGESVLVQFWAAKKVNEKVYVLTTTGQPYCLFGNTEKMKEQYQANLDRKHYAYRHNKPKKQAAFGLAGRVFLYYTPEQTQDGHTYGAEGLCTPRCKYAICSKMGTFAVPVFDTNKSCVGVLEFVMDTLRDYNNDIVYAQSILQDVGLPTSDSIQSDSARTYNNPEVVTYPIPDRSRTTYTSPITWYCCLSPLFGLSSVEARKKLFDIIRREIGESTFANIRKNVGIPEWPYIRNTTVRISNYVPETQINGTVSEGNSFIGNPCAELINRFLKSIDSMVDFGGMTYQDNNSPVIYPDSMVGENSVPIDLPNANIRDTTITVSNYVPETQINGTISKGNSFIGNPYAELIISDYRFRKSPDSMADFGGMTYQDNNSPVIYPDSMFGENSVPIDLSNAIIRNTIVRVSNYVPETQINGTMSKGNSFIGNPCAELINSDYRFLKSPGSMVDFGGMTYQDNNSPVIYPDFMVDENSVPIDIPNANIRNTTVGVSNYVPETQINGTVSKGNSFVGNPCTELINSDYRFSKSPDFMVDFDGVTYQDNNFPVMYQDSMVNEHLVNMDLPNANMTFTEAYKILESSFLGSIACFGELNNQVNDVPMCLDPMDDENSVTMDHPVANMTFITWDSEVSEHTMANDVEPCIESGYVFPYFMPGTHGMECQYYHP